MPDIDAHGVYRKVTLMPKGNCPRGGDHQPGPWIQQTYKSGVKVEVQLCLKCGATLNRRVSK